MRYPYIRSRLNKPYYNIAEETVSVEVSNPTQRNVTCIVKGEIEEEGITFSKEVELFRGETKEISFAPEDFPQLIIKILAFGGQYSRVSKNCMN